VHTLGRLARPERLDRLVGYRSRRRRLGQQATIRPPEAQRPIRLTRDLIAFLVHRPVMPAAQQREIRQRRGPGDE
jgi:hypothetical protein